MSRSKNRQDSGGIRLCVLAGGRSLRMGKDKASLELGGRSLLQIALETAHSVSGTVGVIREDVVAPCGPIGGVITGFERFSEAMLVFLPCDMPFVSRELLERLIAAAAAGGGSVFVTNGDMAGFPFLIARADTKTVRRRQAAGEYSLQGLARELEVERIESADPDRELFNINTPADLARARTML